MPYPGINPWELTFSQRKRRSRELVEKINPGKGFASSVALNIELAKEESERAKRLYNVDIAPEDTSIYLYSTLSLQKNPPPRNLQDVLTTPREKALYSAGIPQNSKIVLNTRGQNRKIIQNAATAAIEEGAVQTAAKLTEFLRNGVSVGNYRSGGGPFVPYQGYADIATY